MSIVVATLSYTYPNRAEPALRRVSLAFKAGELTLIAGASGCGKTTLIRCINGLIPNSYANGRLEGAVTLFGQSNAGLPLSRISQIVGTVLQDPERQIVASTVRNEIAFGLENLGLPRREIVDRIHDVARFLKIDDLLDRQTFRLSGGEKQKVALAGVLAMQPRAVLLDEPLASLDPASSHEALLMMRQLADRGIVVVVIEHRVEDVLDVHPDRCVYMRDGAVTYDGDAAGLIQAIDWREIKLPAPVVIERVRREEENRRKEIGSRRKEIGSRRKEIGSRKEETGDSASVSSFLLPTSYFLSPSSLPPLIEFRRVSFRYDDGPDILRDVSLAVYPGDVVAVLGPNGAGKTTLMKHVIGLCKPTAGEVLIEGRDTRTLTVAQIARTIGFVFQSPSHMLFAPTVRQELSFGPQNIGLDAATTAANITRALAVVNLADDIDTPPLAMSFGQQKRISIASVLAMNPRVLVMDEPTAGQDYASYTKFMNDILVKDEGGRMKDEKTPPSSFILHPSSFKAVLFITHDLDLAITYANRVLLVADGRLAADGAPETVLADRALIERCRIRATSLLEANFQRLPRTGRLLGAAQLAHFA